MKARSLRSRLTGSRSTSRPSEPFRSLQAAFVAAVAVLALGLSGCTAKIGSKCVLSTDCSMQGTLICDPTQPGGYCTQVNCEMNLCPNEAACVEFNATLPGCAFNDKLGDMGARTGESFCMQQCHKNSDCRAGYECVSPLGPPWNAQILDDDQTQKICIGPPTMPFDEEGGTVGAEDFDAAVCQASGPPVPPLDAAITYFPDVGASSDAPMASMMDAPADVSSDALMSLVDTGLVDAGPLDAGASDAEGKESGALDAGHGDAGAGDSGLTVIDASGSGG